MRPTAAMLAMRDPALAALMGAVPGDDFGSDFGEDFGYIADAVQQSDFGDDYEDDMGEDDFGLPIHRYGYRGGRRVTGGGHPALHPANAGKAAAIWDKHHTQTAHKQKREMLLDPNKHSTTKVERYNFPLNSQTLTLGVGVGLQLTGQPDTTIRPQRVVMNAPQPGFATISEIKVANVSVTVGGNGDAFSYSALAQNSMLDMPTLTPANRATVLGNYSGFVPPGFVGGSSYIFCVEFQGPATIAG